MTVYQGVERWIRQIISSMTRREETKQTTIVKFFLQRNTTLNYQCFWCFKLQYTKWISVLLCSLFPYTFITKRVYNVLTKNFKGHRTIIIFPIDYLDHIIHFQLVQLFWRSCIIVQSEDCLYFPRDNLL